MVRQYIVRTFVALIAAITLGIAASVYAEATAPRYTHTDGVMISGWCPNEDSLWSEAEANQCVIQVEAVR